MGKATKEMTAGKQTKAAWEKQVSNLESSAASNELIYM